MIGSVLLLATLLAAGPDVAALRHELDAVAARIEELKARRQAGESVEGELTALLVRSQDLAEEIERARPRPLPPASASAADPQQELVDELRDHAAMLREEAEAVAAELEAVDGEIAEALRGALDPGAPAASREGSAATRLQIVTQGALPLAGRSDLRWLMERRKLLVASGRALQVQASHLDAAADALERERR